MQGWEGTGVGGSRLLGVCGIWGTRDEGTQGWGAPDWELWAVGCSGVGELQ